MPAPRKLSISVTLQGMRVAFERDTALIIRLTVAFAVVNGAFSLLDLTGPLGVAISIGVGFALGAAYGGMVVVLVCLPGRTGTAGEAWSIVRPVLARLIWVTLVVAVVAGLGTAALIIPGLIVATIWSVAFVALLVEHLSVRESLGRSTELVRGNGWRVFGFLVWLTVLGAIAFLLSQLVVAPFGNSGGARIAGGFLFNLIGGPLLAIGPASLYNELTKSGSPPDTDLPAEPED